MKIIILSIFLFAIALIGNSQNKKEQIVVLNNRVDSCLNVINEQTQTLNSNQKTIENSKINLATKKQEISKIDQKISELQQKLEKENKLSEEKNNQIISLKNERDALNKRIPVEAFFKYEITNLKKSVKGRFGTSHSIDIFLTIEGQVVDKYSGFGVPYLDEDSSRVSTSTDLSVTNFIFTSNQSSEVIVSRIIDVDGKDGGYIRRSKKMVYIKNSSGKWEYSHCTGACE